MTLEGLASMLVFFVVLTLIVQIGFLVVVRGAASAAVEGAVRRAGTSGDLAVVQERLGRDLRATVPGTMDAEVSVTSDGRLTKGSVSFDWAPPGPNLIPIRISITRTAPVVVPP
ncbi:MAG: hypothetical protein M5U23_08100 [Acidimicrobiia bacterium]|nr:hypothetical protein [Acidimicrobiia bacterium]